MLVANSTGFSTMPLAYSAAGCFGLAAANTSAGAPCSIWISSAPDPPNVYFALGSMRGKTLVSDAAASTVGCASPAAEVEPADGELPEVVLLELLVPHPAAKASESDCRAGHPGTPDPT